MIRAILEQHVEEVAVLWLLRDTASLSARYDLTALGELDDRIDAHLDGLRIAGRGGLAIALSALETGDAGEVFAAAMLGFGCGDPTTMDRVLEAAATSPELARAVVSALGFLPIERAEGVLRRLFASRDPDLRRVGIAASLAHRRDPGPALDLALADAAPRLRARALRALGELGRVDKVRELRAELRAGDPDCRFWAAWSAALLGDEAAVRVLQAVCEGGLRYAERACEMAVRRLDIREASRWLRAIAGESALRRTAVVAAGALGNPADLPWLIELMERPELARVAFDSATMIAGAELAEETGKAPENFRAGPTDDEEDEDVEMDPDDHLPWPDTGAIERFWQERRKAFEEGTRHLVGAPVTPEHARSVLRRGTQRRRAAGAIELAMIYPEEGVFEVRAPGFRQVRAALPGSSRRRSSVSME